MHGKLAKMIRKYSKRYWCEYDAAICALPLVNRLLFAWHIITKR